MTVRRGLMSGLRGRITAQEKMVLVNKKYGNNNIGDQQGTSRQIYHALPLDGRTLFEFFKDVAVGTGITGETNRPWNNISENKLQVEESLAWYRCRFEVLLVDDETGVFTEVTDLGTAGLPEIYGGDYNIMFDTQVKQKDNPLSSQLPQFSKNANHTTNEWIEFDNDVILIPKIKFQVNLNTPPYTPVENARLRLVVEGFGSILSSMGQS